MCGGPPRVSSMSIDQYLEGKRMYPQVSPERIGYRQGVQCHGGVDWSNRGLYTPVRSGGRGGLLHVENRVLCIV
jgi:hypothetical protein